MNWKTLSQEKPKHGELVLVRGTHNGKRIDLWLWDSKRQCWENQYVRSAHQAYDKDWWARFDGPQIPKCELCDRELD